MTPREAARAEFLATTDWHDALIAPLAGDASARSYARLSGPAGPAILMDAPPELDLKTRAFVDLATHLRQINLSAPNIYAADLTRGFLILEDLGQATVYDRAPQDADAECTLYRKLCDIALHLWAHPPNLALPHYDAREMTAQMDLFADWYCSHTTGSDPAAARELLATLSDRLAQSLPNELGLIHRDYHVQNLLFLPDRSGLASIGILDFQDAMLGPQTYDIASLLTDARQDVPADLRRDMLDHVQRKTDCDAAALSQEFALCALQRNLRIIGIFARLALRDGKPHYPTLLPRVFGYVQEALTHPSLSDLTPLFARAAASPTPEVIANLQSGVRA